MMLLVVAPLLHKYVKGPVPVTVELMLPLLWPLHAGLVPVRLTVGKAYTVMQLLQIYVSLPEEFVTVNVTSYVPGVFQTIFCGFDADEVDGVPPSKVQLNEVGLFVLVLVKSTCVPGQTVLS